MSSNSNTSLFFVTSLVVVSAASFACGSDPGFTDDGAGGDGSGGAAVAKLDSAAKIEGFLESKPLVMEGSNIPSDPMGYNANINFGSATQCYHRTEMTLSGANFHVKSDLGTLNNAPMTGDVGMCDTSKAAMSLMFDSKSFVMENVKGDAECFDILIDYGSFKQEGRGSLSADRKTLKLELYFSEQATGIKCADGNPGASGVTLKGNAFTGNSVQTYTIGG